MNIRETINITVQNFSYFFLKQTMKNIISSKYVLITGITLILIGTFCFGMFMNDNEHKPFPEAAAAWSPEAVQLMQAIQGANDEWNTAQEKIDVAEQHLKDAMNDKLRAEASGKGADLILCAKFQARYDRTTLSLVPDASCPL